MAQIIETVLHLELFVRIGANLAALDGAGAGNLTFGPVPPGKVWLVERVTGAISGATAGTFVLYSNSVVDGNVEDVAPQTALKWAFVEWPPIKLDAGESMILRVTGGAAAAAFNGQLRARQYIADQVCVESTNGGPEHPLQVEQVTPALTG